MLKKIGEPMKIDGIIEKDVKAKCKKCNKALFTIAIDEEDNLRAICECEYLDEYAELEDLDA